MVAGPLALLPSFRSSRFTSNSLPSRTRCWFPPNTSTANFSLLGTFSFLLLTGNARLDAFNRFRGCDCLLFTFPLLSISSRVYQVPIRAQGFGGESFGKRAPPPLYFRPNPDNRFSFYRLDSSSHR